MPTRTQKHDDEDVDDLIDERDDLLDRLEDVENEIAAALEDREDDDRDDDA